MEDIKMIKTFKILNKCKIFINTKLDTGAGNRWDMSPSLIPAIALKRIKYIMRAI